MPIRVLIADDHPIVRDGLSLLISLYPDIEVIGVVDNGTAAVQAAQEHCPDVAILDIGMPEMNGIDCAAAMMRVCPSTHIVMLSIHGTSEYIIRAMQAGAKGYLLKDALSQEIIRAIRTVNAGAYILSKKIAHTLTDLDMDVDRAAHSKSPLARLGPQEQRVLQHVVEGMTSAEIGETLSLSPKTVETYRSRIMAKLGVENLADLVKFAIIHGVTSLDT